ncbi:MAG: hypothetical protein ACRCVT_03725 [Leadbetterella sp.]
MFKTLASFFKTESKTSETEEEETPEVETTEDAPEDAPEEVPEEAPEDAPETGAQISTERYNALLAAETELRGFGANAQARANFLAETKTLYTWYNNVKKVGVKGLAQDANQEQKNKAPVRSSVTKEAMALQAKKEGK